MKYSEEHKRFIVEYRNLSNKELIKKFYDVFGIKLSNEQIRGLRNNIGAFKYNHKKFTKEMDLFLQEHSHMRVSDITKEFNNQFSTEYSDNVVLHRLYRKGIKCKRKTHRWKNDEIEFILENIDLNRDVLAEKVNDKFGINVSKNAIEKYLSRNDLIHDKTIEFSKEEILYIKENFSIMKTEKLAICFYQKFGRNITTHKLREYANNVLGIKKDTISTKDCYEVGHESIRDGRIYITVEKGKKKIPKNRFVYEQYTGESAEGKNVMYLDGNPLNCSPDNLYALENVAFWTLLGNKMLFKENRELTLTAIKYAELMSELKRRKE